MDAKQVLTDIRKEVETILGGYEFKLNSEETHQAMRSQVVNYLEKIKASGLVTYFDAVMDETNNTASQEHGIMDIMVELPDGEPKKILRVTIVPNKTELFPSQVINFNSLAVEPVRNNLFEVEFQGEGLSEHDRAVLTANVVSITPDHIAFSLTVNDDLEIIPLKQVLLLNGGDVLVNMFTKDGTIYLQVKYKDCNFSPDLNELLHLSYDLGNEFGVGFSEPKCLHVSFSSHTTQLFNAKGEKIHEL